MGSGELRHDVPHPYNTESRTRCASRGLWLTFGDLVIAEL